MSGLPADQSDDLATSEQADMLFRIDSVSAICSVITVELVQDIAWVFDCRTCCKVSLGTPSMHLCIHLLPRPKFALVRDFMQEAPEVT